MRLVVKVIGITIYWKVCRIVLQDIPLLFIIIMDLIFMVVISEWGGLTQLKERHYKLRLGEVMN